MTKTNILWILNFGLRGSRVLFCFGLLFLVGCASKGQVYVVPAPPQANTYVKSYDVYPTFKGFEMIIGFPGLKGVPVIGPLLGELIQIRAGTNQDVIIPIMEPRVQPFGAPAGKAPKAVDDSRNRWSQYKKKGQ